MPETVDQNKGKDRGGTNRVLRGGGWNNNARNIRCANRNNNDPSKRNNNVGFRLCQHNFLPGVKGSRLFYRRLKLPNVLFLLLQKQNKERNGGSNEPPFLFFLWIVLKILLECGIISYVKIGVIGVFVFVCPGVTL